MKEKKPDLTISQTNPFHRNRTRHTDVQQVNTNTLHVRNTTILISYKSYIETKNIDEENPASKTNGRVGPRLRKGQ